MYQYIYSLYIYIYIYVFSFLYLLCFLTYSVGASDSGASLPPGQGSSGHWNITENFRPKNFLPNQHAWWCLKNPSNNLLAAKPSEAKLCFLVYVFLVLGCGCACALFRVVLVRRSWKPWHTHSKTMDAQQLSLPWLLLFFGSLLLSELSLEALFTECQIEKLVRICKTLTIPTKSSAWNFRRTQFSLNLCPSSEILAEEKN